MRSILVLFAGAAIVSASGTECAQNEISELVSRTTCGCPKLITACLGRNVDLESLEEIEQCFVDGGCSEKEATEQAVLFAQECHPETVAEDRDDLRKRADHTTTEKAKATSADAQTTSTETTTSDSSPATTAAPSATAAPASTTADSSSSTDSSTSITSATSATSTDSTTITSASATPTGPESCYVTSIKSTSACSIHAGTTVTCIPTTTAIQSCAPGLLCFSPTAGASSCMKKQDNLTTSGLVVTIVFAGGIGAALFAWAILCLRSRNRNKRQEALQRMMGSSGKGLDTEYASPFAAARNQAMRSDANLPLITPGGIRSDQQSYGHQEGYFEHGPEGSAVPPVPKIQIHPGLGSVGQQSRM